MHPVRLVATDSKGNPLGSVDELDIRSNTVSKVIWVILGAGVGILMLVDPDALGPSPTPEGPAVRRSRVTDTIGARPAAR